MQNEGTLLSKLVKVYDQKQGPANFVCKEPDSTYFRHCQPSSLLQLLNSAMVAQKQPQTLLYYNYYVVVPIKLYL